MRPRLRELVGAEIEDAVDVSGVAADVRRDGTEQRLENQPSLVGERAAGEESEHARASRSGPRGPRQAGPDGGGVRERTRTPRFPAGERGGARGRVLECWRPMPRSPGARRSPET